MMCKEASACDELELTISSHTVTTTGALHITHLVSFAVIWSLQLQQQNRLVLQPKSASEPVW